MQNCVDGPSILTHTDMHSYLYVNFGRQMDVSSTFIHIHPHVDLFKEWKTIPLRNVRRYQKG